MDHYRMSKQAATALGVVLGLVFIPCLIYAGIMISICVKKDFINPVWIKFKRAVVVASNAAVAVFPEDGMNAIAHHKICAGLDVVGLMMAAALFFIKTRNWDTFAGMIFALAFLVFKIVVIVDVFRRDQPSSFCKRCIIWRPTIWLCDEMQTAELAGGKEGIAKKKKKMKF